MKYFIVGLAALAVTLCVQEPVRAEFYYGGDSTIALRVDTAQVSIKFDPEYLMTETMLLVARLQSIVADPNAVNGFQTVTFTPGVDIYAFLDTLNSTAGILAAEPYYFIDDSLAAPVGDQFVVAFVGGLSHDSIRALALSHGADTVGELDYMPNVYVLRNSTPQAQRLLNLANALQNVSGVRFSHPIFGLRPVRMAYKLFDYYNSYQWHTKKIIGTFNSRSVWDFHQVKEPVVVAVIDDGVTTHEDLPGIRILAGRDYSNTSGYDKDPAPGRSEAHGMGCAGIIAASHTTDSVSGLNPGSGVISVSPAVQILPVKIFSDSGAGTSFTQIAVAISYAYKSGADVLSCSWGYNSTVENLIPVISAAVDSAASYGRYGKGCPVIFAAGNSAGLVTYPANRPLCMAVGALRSNDSRWPYSCYGNALDISAPSGDMSLLGDVWTLDQMDSSGNNPTYKGRTWNCGYPNDMDYNCKFGGTSAACPLVAGVAAIILSKDRNMSRSQVYTCLKSSAVMLGSSQPSYDFGWGRVDAFRAALSLSHGDNNQNGIIDLTDLNILVQYLEGAGVTPFPSIALADWNCNDAVNISDLSAMVSYLTGGGGPPPVKPCFKFALQ